MSNSSALSEHATFDGPTTRNVSGRLLGIAAMAALCALLGCDSASRPAGDTARSAAATAEPAPTAPTASEAAPLPNSSLGQTSAGTVPPKADPARLKLRGQAIQGGLVMATVEPNTRGIKFPGHKVVISEQGEFLIAFFRNAPKTETLTITFPDGAVLDHVFDVEQRQYEPDVINGLPDGQIKLSPEFRKKLREANERIDSLRDRYTKEAHYRDGFIWPVQGRITSRYGQPRVLNGVKAGIHWGVDIAAPLGTSVRAVSGGKVVFAEKNVPLAGHMVVVDHGHGLSSSFLHLRSFAVTVGQQLEQGEVFAQVGMTGRANGPHLDWRVNYFKVRLDPELLPMKEKDAGAPKPPPAQTAGANSASSDG